MEDYTHHLKADALVKEGRYQEALSLLDRAVNLHPTDANALHDRAVCLFQLKRGPLALADLNAAVALQPLNPYRYSSRGFIRAALGDSRGAMADYQQALSLDPDDAITLNNLGLLEEKMGYEREAKERFEVADELLHIMQESGISRSEEPVLPQVPAAVEEPSVATHMRAVLTRKSAFREFIAFCREGFKLPRP